MQRVLLESPFAGKGATLEERKAEEALNVEYARACMHDCFERGEAPYASHLLYTQKGVLDDDIPHERALGIDAGLLWGAMAEKSVVYLDRGFSTGMQYGIRNALAAGRPIEFRSIRETEPLLEKVKDLVPNMLPTLPQTYDYELDRFIQAAANHSKMEIVPFITQMFE